MDFPKRWVGGITSALFMAMLTAEIAFFPRMAPIQPGTSPQFWSIAVHANSLGGDHYIGEATIIDGTCIYSIGGLHGQYLFQLPESQAMRDWPAVTREFDARVLAAAANDLEAKAYKQWQALPATEGPNLTDLFDRISDVRVQRVRNAFPDRPLPEATQYEARSDFFERIEKSRYYWATFLFDIVLLTSLLLLLVLPLWRGDGLGRMLICWSLVPLLFFAASWLGYASRTRSHWDPNGGVLYPWLLMYSGYPLPNANWEYAFTRVCPPVLSGISQDIGGPVLSISGSRIQGPVDAALYSASFAFAALVLYLGRQDWLNSHKPRGFEVQLSPLHNARQPASICNTHETGETYPSNVE